jgi:hypothetical protein
LSPHRLKAQKALSGSLDYFSKTMFKFFSGSEGKKQLAFVLRARFCGFPDWVSRLGLLTFLGTAGCRDFGPPMPPANLQEPGWTVREGQAVWRKKGSPGVAGEVLVATRADGRSFVHFTKPPFPMVNAQATPNHWEVNFPAQNKRYSGPGIPPERVIWLHLPRVLLGSAPPKNWIWHQSETAWRLENRATGESVEGVFMQAGR